MNVNFEYYKIFYYVAKYENFTKAARVLGNSQPNITRAMNSLEQQIHSTLFVRTNRGVQLTPEGQRIGGNAAVMGGRGGADRQYGTDTWKYCNRRE